MRIEEKEDMDEEGFITEDDEEDEGEKEGKLSAVTAKVAPGDVSAPIQASAMCGLAGQVEEEEESKEEERIALFPI